MKKVVKALIGRVDWDLILRLGIGLGQSRSGSRLKLGLDKGKMRVGVGLGLGPTCQAQPKMRWHLKRTGPSFEKGSTSSAGPSETLTQQWQQPKKSQ